MKKIMLIFTWWAWFSCTNPPVSNTSMPSSIKTDSIDFTLDSFIEIPDEIDGCGCYFYLSKNDELKEKYLFVNDFANVAFVAINKQVEKFELKQHNEQNDTYLYSNGLFDLKIVITKKNTKEYETANVEGRIILSKGPKTISKPFIGICGC